MMKSVALLIVGLTAVYAQFSSSTPAPFYPSPSPYYQPYPYQQYNQYAYPGAYPGAYPYNQYQRSGYYPYVQPTPQAPSTVVVKKIFNAPAPVAPPKYYAQPAYVAPTPVYAAPQLKSGVADKDANIVAESREVNFDGTFAYGFDSDNGISVKSKGYLKNPGAPNEDAIQVIEGSYSYYDREGKPVSISYIADEAGYRAFGEAIPTPPEEYARAIANAPPPAPEKK